MRILSFRTIGPSTSLFDVMPGFYQHGIMAPAIHMAGHVHPMPLRDRFPGVRYESVGTLMALSTASQQCPDYELYWSEADYAMGPLHQRWQYMGTIFEIYGAAAVPIPTMSPVAIQHVFGAIYTELYAFGNYNGNVDVYTRSSWTMPLSKFSHYQVAAQEPTLWWTARSIEFLGIAIHEEWVLDPPQSRL